MENECGSMRIRIRIHSPAPKPYQNHHLDPISLLMDGSGLLKPGSGLVKNLDPDPKPKHYVP